MFSRRILPIAPFVFVVCGLALLYAFDASSIALKTKPSVLLYPPKQLEHFTLGYREVAADVLWIRVIQDFDICEQSKAAPGAPQLPPAFRASDEHVERKPSRCTNSWVYQMIDIVTELAPKFKTSYVAGATMLSILVDDREGALRIYEKGVQQFPEDWRLNYGLGYHYLYEMQDLEKAGAQLKLAAEHGAPPWVYALAANIYSKTGQAQLGISVLEDALAKDPQGPGAERIQYRLDILKKELAKARSEDSKQSATK